MPEIETVQGKGSGGAEALIANGAARPGIGSYVGTVALVGLGVAFIEEELLAGMAIGVAAMAFPNLAPKMGAAFRPLLKSAVRAGYGIAARTRETVAEMSEQFQDVRAEVRAEHEHQESGAETAPEQETARPAATAAPAHDAEHARGRRGRSTPSGEQVE